MRKAISTVVVACAFLAGASGVATAAGKHVSTRRCGHRYTPSCTKPHITSHKVSPKCVVSGTGFKLPKITFTSNSGIRRIQVRENGRSVKLVKFKGQGKTQYKLSGLKLRTLGLNSGPHVVSVKVTDIRGRSASKTMRFAVCVATPVFTG